MIEHSPVAMLCLGNVTKEKPGQLNRGWLDSDKGVNVDVLALATYGMAANKMLLDRWLSPIHTDTDKTTNHEWQPKASGQAKDWQVVSKPAPVGWTLKDKTDSHSWS